MARIPKPWFREDRQAYFVTIGGKRHNLGPDKKEANRLYHELLGRPEELVAAPPPVPAGPLSVGQVFEKYLEWCQQHRSPRTYEWTQKHIQRFCDRLKFARTMPARDLRPFHLVEFVDSKDTWGPNQKRGAIVALSRPFNWAAKIGYLDASPVRGVEKPQAKKRDSQLTPADFESLLALVKDQPFLDLLTFAYEAGCRPQEARHIEARHVKLEKHRIEIPPPEAKGKRRWRVVYLSAKAAEIVIRLMKDRPEGKLFLNVDGNPWKAQAIVCRFQRLLIKLGGKDSGIPPVPRFDRRRYSDPAKLAAARREQRKKIIARRKALADAARENGKRFAMYDLRHLFATRKLKEGHDPITVAALLGHKDGSMLCKFYESLSTDGDHLRQAVN